MEWLTELVLGFLAGNPHLALLITLMSVSRALFKPLCSIIQAYVDSTPNEEDNQKWLEFQNSKGFKAVAYMFDYLLSIKLPVSK